MLCICSRSRGEDLHAVALSVENTEDSSDVALCCQLLPNYNLQTDAGRSGQHYRNTGKLPTQKGIKLPKWKSKQPPVRAQNLERTLHPGTQQLPPARIQTSCTDHVATTRSPTCAKCAVAQKQPFCHHGPAPTKRGLSRAGRRCGCRL